MLKPIVVLMALLAGTAASATDGMAPGADAVARWEADKGTVFEASEIDLGAFLWIARPVIVFADSPADPAFRQQLDLLEADLNALAERDVIIITDTSPDMRSELRTEFRPRGFMLTLVGKDGDVKLRKPFPWHVRELTRSIDKMPLRQQEMRDSRRTP